ncbi:MAG: hypothetical protein QM680_10560 [Luteolibacter sp.]
MSHETDLLAWHSRDLGISRKELREMCFRSGLESLNRGELKVTPVSNRLPVFLPRGMVLLLRELCEGAADLEGGADGFVEGILEYMVNETPKCAVEIHTGIVEMIASGWILGGENGPEGVVRRMIDVAHQWERDESGSVRKKGGARLMPKARRP